MDELSGESPEKRHIYIKNEISLSPTSLNFRQNFNGEGIHSGGEQTEDVPEILLVGKKDKDLEFKSLFHLRTHSFSPNKVRIVLFDIPGDLVLICHLLEHLCNQLLLGLCIISLFAILPLDNLVVIERIFVLVPISIPVPLGSEKEGVESSGLFCTKAQFMDRIEAWCL